MTDVSFVIVTHNRRTPLAATLRHLAQLYGAPSSTIQPCIYVVDNASTDDTIAMLASEFPTVHVIPNASNNGAGARSLAFPMLTTEFVVLLDDDSFPVGDAIERSTAYLQSHPECGAVVGDVVLPDGRHEACAFPQVMLSGAVCIRTSVLHTVGGFREEFFRKAGEYDLSFRMWNAGHGVIRFEDILYRHEKVSFGRSPALAHFMDLRNNLILVERFLPRHLRRIYRHDWLHRYARLAMSAGHRSIISDAVREARQWAETERTRGRDILNPNAIEILFQFEHQSRQVHQFLEQHRSSAGHLIQNVLIADCSKNLYATYRACKENHLSITAILDEHPAHANEKYRGIPIQPTTDATMQNADAIIISTVNPAQIRERFKFLSDHFHGPIAMLWEPRTSDSLRGDEEKLMSEPR